MGTPLGGGNAVDEADLLKLPVAVGHADLASENAKMSILGCVRGVMPSICGASGVYLSQPPQPALLPPPPPETTGAVGPTYPFPAIAGMSLFGMSAFPTGCTKRYLFTCLKNFKFASAKFFRDEFRVSST